MKNNVCALIDKATGKEIPLKAVAVTGSINGLNTSYEVVQKFTNDESVAIEAVFTFPLPADATLSSLKITIGDKTLTAKVEEREKAFEEYDAAIQEGNGAYMLDQERPDLFVINLGNILPKQQVEVQINMFQMLQAQNDTVRFSFPVAVVPKYFPATDSAQKAEWDRITPDFGKKVPYGFSFSLKIVQNSRIRLVESPSHPIRVEYGDNQAYVSLYHATSMPDTDVVVNFAVAEKFGTMLSHCSFDGQEHLLVELYPDFAAENTGSNPKEVVFVVDCSGSMAGDSIREAVNALQLCVRSLNEGDLFQIICFGSSWQQLFDKAQVLNNETLAEVSAKIASIDANMGGTEIHSALQGAVQAMSREFSDMILFTDGAVSNEEEVFKFITSIKHRCRVFPFGIGNGVSESLVRGIAERGNGRAEFVFPGERIEAKVLRQFKRLNTPSLSNISISWNCEGIEQSPAKIPIIFAGETFRIAARLKDGVGLPSDLKVELKAWLGDRELVFTANSPQAVDNSVPALWWAQQRLNDLESNAGSDVSGSRQQRNGVDKQQKAIIKLSKTYSIICSLTSMLAIEERSADQKNDGKVEFRRVPVMVPARREFMGNLCMPSLGECLIAPQHLLSQKPPLSAKLASRSNAKNEKHSMLVHCCVNEFIASDTDSFTPSGSDNNVNNLVDILMHASADGMFVMSKKLLKLLRATPANFAEWLAKAPAHLAKPERESYAMTAMVKNHLETIYAEQKDIWEAMVTKGQRKMLALANTGAG